MRYVCINDRDYIMVENHQTAFNIIQEWLRVKGKPFSIEETRRWQLLRHNANGTLRVLGNEDVPEYCADFNIIEIGDNA